jgi:hypothetical protein
MRVSRYRRLVFFLALGTVSGCATTGKFRKNMDSWIAGDVNTAIMRWGPPSNTFDMPNGNRMYTWTWQGGAIARATYNPYLGMTTASATRVSCQVSLTTEHEGRIVAWQAQGNACRAR